MSSRVDCREIGSAVECRIKTWKYWIHILVWPPMLPLWILAVIETLTDPTGGKLGRGAVMYIWLVVWLGFACLFTWEWFWRVFGKQIIYSDGKNLTITNDVFLGIGRTQHFDAALIRDLHVCEPFGAPDMWRMTMSRAYVAREERAKFCSQGSICFFYSNKKRRFGAQLTEEDARLVVETLKGYLPESAFPAQ